MGVGPAPGDKEDHDSLPKVGGLEPSEVLPGSPFAANPRHHPQGLSGGALDISDAIYLLNYLFLGGPRPFQPFL